MESIERRVGLLGRWSPIVLYAVIVLGWFAEGASHTAAARHLWLVAWTIPAPVLFLWRTRRQR
jgi:hypothetical protein